MSDTLHEHVSLHFSKNIYCGSKRGIDWPWHQFILYHVRILIELMIDGLKVTFNYIKYAYARTFFRVNLKL